MNGTITDSTKVHKYHVSRAKLEQSGKGRVGIHERRRDSAKRHQVLRITRADNGKRIYAAAIGLKPKERCCVIRIDRDYRDKLDVQEGAAVRLEIRKANVFETLYWYLTVNDPVVRVSSVLALISVLLGSVSIILALAGWKSL